MSQYGLSSAFHGAFNARWLSPEQVARQFVPINQFAKLTHSKHSLLLGPRGSGKTTLLKMLTGRALNVWYAERHDPHEPPPFEIPAFEAIYVPSDVRWSYELRHLDDDPTIQPIETELAQRCFVGGSALIALCDVFEWKIRRLPADEQHPAEIAICEELISLYKLERTLPHFKDVRSSVDARAGILRGILNRRSPGRLGEFLESVPDFLIGHALDGLLTGCRIFEGICRPLYQGGITWALCFDELEIAPPWLRHEILESLRSVDQSHILKATYSPLLPTGIRTAPEPSQDFQRIRLWHSHVQDARIFCEDLAQRFLREKFPEQDVTPGIFFRYSALASGLPEDAEDPTSYDRDSNIYRQMKELSQDDRSFRYLLASRGIDPNDPFSEDQLLRDTLFRKIKPVVMLRMAFGGHTQGRMRSRKVYTVYAGREAIFAMSEGNPRWLLGLLTDLYDRWAVMRDEESGVPYVRYNDQAKILSATARRYHSSLAATPVRYDHEAYNQRFSLIELIDGIGQALQNQLLTGEFPLDPYGSFAVDDPVSTALRDLIEKGSETGALVYIGSSEEDVPQRVEGSRFRLSFMLSPVYKLPFRNYRDLLLSTILSRSPNPDQLDIPEALDEEKA